MTSQQIENLFACRVLTSLLNAATSVVQMYKGIHPNIHHPWVEHTYWDENYYYKD